MIRFITTGKQEFQKPIGSRINYVTVNLSKEKNEPTVLTIVSSYAKEDCPLLNTPHGLELTNINVPNIKTGLGLARFINNSEDQVIDVAGFLKQCE